MKTRKKPAAPRPVKGVGRVPEATAESLEFQMTEAELLRQQLFDSQVNLAAMELTQAQTKLQTVQLQRNEHVKALTMKYALPGYRLGTADAKGKGTLVPVKEG